MTDIEEKEKLRVILCRPGEAAEVVEIEDELESMQELVGGLIEPYDPFYSETDPRYKDDPDTPIMKGGKVAVVGGGNVAMDAARTALRLGAEKVYIVYRRSMEELPARAEEVEHAQEEGIDFRLLTNPVEILGYENHDDPRDPANGSVRAIRCIKMELGEPDDSGRRRPVPVHGSEFELEVDAVIMSIGTSPNPLIKDTTEGLEVNRRGCIVVDDGGLTSRKAVYAGGDAVTGAATVVSAMGAGKVAARSIDEALSSN